MTKNAQAIKEALLGPVTDMNQLQHLFHKTYTNMFPSCYDGDMTQPMLYRREDLAKWAKEACERGEKQFYADPVDPKDPEGTLKLAKPNYKYKLSRSLTEEEFQALFSKN